MKKIYTTLIFSLFFILFSTSFHPVFAAGQVCCPTQGLPDYQGNCVWTPYGGVGTQSIPDQCDKSAGEICIDASNTNFLLNRGTCSTSTPNVGIKCCRDGYQYRENSPSGQECQASKVYINPQYVPTQCGSDQICYRNNCISGDLQTDPTTTSLDATKPKTCCIGEKTSTSVGALIDSLNPFVTETDDVLDFQVPTCPIEQQGIQTALGCIPTSTAPFVNYVLKRAVSIGGGIAFILMLVGAFVLITSAGNPESVKKGKDIITSAIVGLLFIIFAIFLLKFIGVDILKLPEFKDVEYSIPAPPQQFDQPNQPTAE